MRICMIVEGAYPYITGGVSNWIHQLVTNMEEFEFIIITIMAEGHTKGKFKYKLPKNVVGVEEYFLDEILYAGGKRNKKINLSKKDIEVLGSLIAAKEVDWNSLFEIFSRKEIRKLSASDLLLSKPFFSLIKESYEKSYSHSPFTEVYWTIQSMYLPFFSILLQEYPEADLYHSVSTGYAGIIGAYAALTSKKPYLITEHGIYTREREEEIIKSTWVQGELKDMWIDFFYSLSDAAYFSANQVISLFEKNRDIQIEIGCPKEKTLVIHNGVDITRFKDIAFSVNNREEENVNIGAIVRVVPIKDIKTMLDAFWVVNKNMDNVNFYIMGPVEEDQEYYEECLKHKEYLKLDNLTFTGGVDVKEYLKDMDLLVLTSISEGQPLAILEGMASRIPFVATNVGDCKGLITGEDDDLGPAGKVANVMNYIDIAEKIMELCNDKTLRKKYGETGYKRVKEFYSLDKFIEAYRNIYKYLLMRG